MVAPLIATIPSWQKHIILTISGDFKAEKKCCDEVLNMADLGAAILVIVG